MTVTVTLRPMSRDDVEAVAAVERVTYAQPWSEAIFRDELTAPGRTYLIADAAGEVAGYAGLMLVGDEAHVTTVVVHPDRRGDRIGTRLMLALVEAGLAEGARSLTLEVRQSNVAAQRLYRRFGLAPVGVRKRYYITEDALIMWAHDIDGDAYRAVLDQVRKELG